ncbi:probable salivary secreted peptide [Ostrinia furnacalis]|uniref:probable salivary secreted peptide n=1 Tax=Ostrinia furnacalis TaxID=93504 RepID=UPI00103974F5|nr:probable salivary secreted peptide [Ostrinia furnacalis]
MRTLTCVFVASVLVCVSGTNYFFGEKTPTTRLVQRNKVFYEAIPLMKRVKFHEYAGPNNLVIKAIYCYDYQNSDASVNITDGGLGTNHVTLRMKSQRSYRIDYVIEIYQ